ncbi:hypothetical protein G3O08_11880 [Cryomorpha ignava]|uniref:Uncharacterized protein n=1 Tax=Cryomorpha ignava TaxID=101383 RepID=A0A7K3WTJ5_9FLAO|nr:hypothetical protein [Cryomorpha ignava]NEN24202.1 hypothetical protein [Cryomorpha ignava]
MKYQFVENYNVLVKQLNDFKSECTSILKSNSNKTTEEFNELIDQWEERLISCIVRHIAPKPSFLINAFHAGLGNIFFDDLMHRYFAKGEEGKQLFFNSLVNSKLKGLRIINGYLLILNDINQNPIPEVNNIQKKFDYLMHKLYLVYSEDFYSVEYLLDLNGIDYRGEEPAGLGEALRLKGYVKSTDRRNLFIKLTVKGAAYLERKVEASNKSKNQLDSDELIQKIDLVINKLQSLGYGHEILFNEIEELKSAASKLNKKNWMELLKGKVLDLVVDEI